MSLEIYLDPKDPLAYLAIQGIDQLLASTAVPVQWFPMQVDNWAALGPEPAKDAGRGVRHRWFRAAYREREFGYYASVQQLPLVGLYRQTDSSRAAMALLWLAEQVVPDKTVTDFLSRLTQQHWADEQNGMDTQADLIPLLADHNPSGFLAFCEQDGPEHLARQQQRNAELGVIRGPAFRYQEQLYIGHEHLPLLAELISE